MNQICLCIKNENPHAESAVAELGAKGWTVLELSDYDAASRKNMLERIEKDFGHLDLLILGSHAGFSDCRRITDKPDTQQMIAYLDQQINGMKNTINDSLPLLRNGDGKRIALITSALSSISMCQDDCDFTWRMSLAGMNMLGKLFFNVLRPEGFTFRWYCASDEAGGFSAGQYILSNFCYDSREPYQHSDENRFVMRDAFLREVAW